MIEMLKELIEYGNNIKEEMKVTLSEIKKNLQGTNSEGKEAGIQHKDNSWMGTNHIQYVGEVTENGVSVGQTSRSQAATLFPRQALPPYRATKQ